MCYVCKYDIITSPFYDVKQHCECETGETTARVTCFLCNGRRATFEFWRFLVRLKESCKKVEGKFLLQMQGSWLVDAWLMPHQKIGHHNRYYSMRLWFTTQICFTTAITYNFKTCNNIQFIETQTLFSWSFSYTKYMYVSQEQKIM